MEPVLLAVSLCSDEERLLRHAVGSVRLLRVAVPQVLFAERHGRELRVRAHGADDHELLDVADATLLEHVSAHHQVRVPVATGVREVRADPADLRGEVEDALRIGLLEHALGVLRARQVVARLPCGKDVVTLGLESLDEMRAEEPAAAGDEDPHRSCAATVGLPVLSQSTRPIQRSRFSAYHAIVLAIPSSHDMSGSQPVSSLSFS